MIEILLIVTIILLLLIIWLFFSRTNLLGNKSLREIKNSIELFDNSLEKVDRSIKDDFQRNREESNKTAKENRDELAHSLNSFNKMTDDRLNKIRETVEARLKSIQDDNNQKLEKMRETVDEKLHKTLEQRLGESFKIVSDRLEKVQKGLGEMQVLATGVGDLKRVLSNVKTRGVLGEYQLENILEQLLTSDQYAKNVKTKAGSDAFVEFAIKLPGKKEDERVVWLPIDSKFPIEDYQLLMEAYEQADSILLETIQKELAKKIKIFAKDIRDKYIDPPNTTDFAIMFLPIEGLYAEILRNSALFESLQRDFRIIITGPTTLSALINSLQMGFRTLAIEKRSSEVWEILAAVKTEFGKFGDILDKTKKKLQEASHAVDSAGERSRAIERKLKHVQELPVKKSSKLLQPDKAKSTP
jgi:DNA recombination protein RmuC